MEERPIPEDHNCEQKNNRRRRTIILYHPFSLSQLLVHMADKKMIRQLCFTHIQHGNVRQNRQWGNAIDNEAIHRRPNSKSLFHLLLCLAARRGSINKVQSNQVSWVAQHYSRATRPCNYATHFNRCFFFFWSSSEFLWAVCFVGRL